MSYNKNFTRVNIKCIASQPPMPHHKYFKHNEDVLIKFKSGFYTIGRIRSIDMGPQYPGGPRVSKLLVLFRTPRGGRSYELDGQTTPIPAAKRVAAGWQRIQQVLNLGPKKRKSPPNALYPKATP